MLSGEIRDGETETGHLGLGGAGVADQGDRRQQTAAQGFQDRYRRCGTVSGGRSPFVLLPARRPCMSLYRGSGCRFTRTEHLVG